MNLSNDGANSACQGLDFACIETQIGDGSTMDCEIIYLDPSPRYSLELSEEDTLEVGVH